MEEFNSNNLPDLDQLEDSGQELTAWVYRAGNQDYLLHLLHTSSYEGRMRERIERDIDNNSMGEDEYYALLENLQNAQVDRISSGMSYSQGDILIHLKALK